MTKQRFWVLLALCSALALGSGCTVGTGDDDDTETDTDSQMDSETDSTADSTTDSETDSTADSETDTALDGVGGADEECYVGLDGTDEIMWCDGDLVANTCADFASNCCCRTPCEPTVCPAVDSDEGDAYCLSLGGGVGVCSYAIDDEPVGYTCEDTCISRSQCEFPDETTGECLDDPLPEELGVCLFYEDAPDVDYCSQICELATCGDTHTCEAAVADGSYDGTGICMPNI